jgi:hypothetical protein
MLFRSRMIRLMAIPACMVWGLKELIALQRAHGLQRKLQRPNRT